MNVLSLFDGMSCGQIALNRAGIKYDNYYASEIEEAPIKVTQHNYPNTIQLGDVTKINIKELPKIDLLIGGSPCQSFSNAGTQDGFNGKSGLFWEYVRILKESNPKYFLLENVVMKKEWENIISESLGVKPVLINSSLVSAQNRKRLYWTNIPNILQPKDKNILLKNILEKGAETYKEKSYALTLHTGTVRDFFIKSQSNIVFIKDENGKLIVADGFVHFSLPKSKEPFKIHKIKCNLTDGNYSFRTLTTSENESLQTIPIGYTSIVNKTQAQNMIGNGWTVDVITHIFNNLC